MKSVAGLIALGVLTIVYAVYCMNRPLQESTAVKELERVKSQIQYANHILDQHE